MLNKFLNALLLVCAVATMAMAANETTLGLAGTVVNSPDDLKGYELLRRNVNVAKDTFATTTRKVFGPYPLANSSTGPMAKGFQMLSDVITGTTPVASFEYQVIAGLTMKDTVNEWVSAPGCTLGTTGKNTYVDLSSKAGQAIVFRVYNYDNTETVLPGLLKVYIKDATVYQKNR